MYELKLVHLNEHIYSAPIDIFFYWELYQCLSWKRSKNIQFLDGGLLVWSTCTYMHQVLKILKLIQTFRTQIYVEITVSAVMSIMYKMLLIHTTYFLL